MSSAVCPAPVDASADVKQWFATSDAPQPVWSWLNQVGTQQCRLRACRGEELPFACTGKQEETSQ